MNRPTPIERVHILDNFTADDVDEWGCRVFCAPDKAGFVTVDYQARVFRTGIVRHGKGNCLASDYTGRGWRKRLELDAQTHLAGILAT